MEDSARGSLNTSCEPMDVDHSLNSINLSFNREERVDRSLDTPSDPVSPLKNGSEPEVWNIKKYHIVRNKNQKQNSKNVLLFVTFITLIISIIVYCVLSIRCSQDLNLKELKFKLQNRLYGQMKVTNDLVRSLESDATSKILFLYGGTGVGKTYTISLALENFWNSSNVYHYTMPSFVNSFSADTMLGLNICESSIMVVDDLKHNDFQVKQQIKDVIKKSESLKKKITIILIYNCDLITRNFVKRCDESFYSELRHQFDDIHVYKSFIEFEPLTREVLKKCVEDVITGTEISDIDWNNILNNFDVTLDGCKGVYKKVKFLNIL